MLTRFREVPLLVILMGIAAVLMFVPAIHGSIMRTHWVARPFAYGGVVLLAMTVMVGLATVNHRVAEGTRSHLWGLLGAYIVLPFILALPFHQAQLTGTFLDAWFEMVSALTTTGATLHEDPSALSPTLHLWRAMVGWIGGLFILVAAMAILAPLNLGGIEVITGHAPGGGRQDLKVADPADRMLRHTVAVLPVYVALTFLLWAGLTVAGESAFVALCHAMSTLSSSGISPVDGMAGASAGFAGELLIFLFLFLGVTRRAWPGSTPLTRNTPVWADVEIRLAIATCILVALVLVLRRWLWVLELDTLQGAGAVARATWGALFTSLSFLTTNGFSSEHWNTTKFWSGMDSPGVLLAGLAMMGGGVATTAGGIKLLRIYALLRQGEQELEQLIHPSVVTGSGNRDGRMRRDGAYLAWIFLVLFGLTVAAVLAFLTLIGMEFEPALLFSIASITNTGPLALEFGADGFTYSALEPAAKIVMGIGMIVGRIEIVHPVIDCDRTPVIVAVSAMPQS